MISPAENNKAETTEEAVEDLITSILKYRVLELIAEENCSFEVLLIDKRASRSPSVLNTRRLNLKFNHARACSLELARGKTSNGTAMIHMPIGLQLVLAFYLRLLDQYRRVIVALRCHGRHKSSVNEISELSAHHTTRITVRIDFSPTTQTWTTGWTALDDFSFKNSAA